MKKTELTGKQRAVISDLNLHIGAVRGIQAFIICLAVYEYYTGDRGPGGLVLAGIIAAYMQLYAMPGLPDFMKEDE